MKGVDQIPYLLFVFRLRFPSPPAAQAVIELQNNQVIWWALAGSFFSF